MNLTTRGLAGRRAAAARLPGERRAGAPAPAGEGRSSRSSGRACCSARSCVSLGVFVELLREPPHAPIIVSAVVVAAGRQAAGRLRLSGGPALGGDAADRHRRREPDPPVQRRLHAGGPGLRPVLLVSESVRRVHAGAGAGLELPGDVHRLGRRGALLLPADRVLVQRQGQRRRRQEGLHHEPDRRLRLPDRHVLHLARVRDASTSPVRDRARRRHARAGRRHRHRDHAVPLPGLHRQVGADPALHLAPRRDGGPDARSPR